MPNDLQQPSRGALKLKLTPNLAQVAVDAHALQAYDCMDLTWKLTPFWLLTPYAKSDRFPTR